ncbi:MAG: M15 family metallopeptidase [Acidobacteriota bacterium]
MWPKDTREALDTFYGRHSLGFDGTPTARWRRDNLVTFKAPYRLTLSWDLSAHATRVTCHRRVAESLERILAGILEHYGSLEAVQQNRMHLYGGCYNYRPVRNGNRLSTHAWGAAIDLDPERNPLGVPYDESAGMMPRAVVDLFEAEGWTWGGTWPRRPDCMHFQATS